MKRLFSKKSGFSLVEILVAFMVFAIMATLLVQVLNLTINRRTENQNYERYLLDQEKTLVSKGQKWEFDSTANIDGALDLKFKDQELNDMPMSLNYQLRTVDGTVNDKSGLNYFVGDIVYAEGLDKTESSDDENDGDDDDVAAGGSSQMSRFDTRLTGTKGVTKVVVKATPGNESKTIYNFSVTVYDSGVNSLIKNHSQVTLFFGEDKSGGTPFTVVSVNNGEKSTEKIKYVKACGENGVNVHCPDDHQGFNGRTTTFTIKFEAPVTNLGFGDNGTGVLSDGITYTPYNGYSNIFGAYEKAS